MKKFLVIILVIFLVSNRTKIFARDAYVNNKYYCEKGNGVWREFGNRCGNYCSSKINKGICSPNLLMACDCGEKNCWDEEENKCWNIKKYQEKIQAEIDAKIAEERRIEEQKKAEEKRIADEKAAAEKKAADDKLAAEKKAAEDKKAAEQKKIDDKKAEDEKKKLEEDKKIEEKKEEKKPEEIKPENKGEEKMDNNATPPISDSTNPGNGDIKIRDINDVIKQTNNLAQ